MSLSFPIPVLKNLAKKLQYKEGISRAQALDRVAQREGYATWSLLAARHRESSQSRPESVLVPGTLVLVAGRPGEGKTTYAMSLLAHALGKGLPGWYFSLHNQSLDIASQLARSGCPPRGADALTFVEADDITATSIEQTVAGRVRRGSVVVVDFLQALDQRRSSPDINTQVNSLSELARATECVVVFTAQVSRSYRPGSEGVPAPDDIRQLNPINLARFDTMLFMHSGKMGVLGRRRSEEALKR